jgi:carbonic anhydrase
MKPASLLTAALAAAPLALVVGCATSTVPAERIASSESSIRAAHELGADRTPNAALHLRLAEDQLTQAKALIEKGDNKRAEWVLYRAEADAELAVALSKETTTRDEAQKALESVRALKTQSLLNQQSQKGGIAS